MNEHTAYQQKGQGSRHQSDVLAELCYRFVRLLLQELHTKMDRRLVHTFLDLLPVIVLHRHRNHGLLLSELGGNCWERNTLRRGMTKTSTASCLA